MLGFVAPGSHAQLARTASTRLQLLLPLLLFYPLIHSHKMTWISSTPPIAPPYCLPSQSNLQPNSFNAAALVDLQVKYSSIFSACPSCLSNLKACCGKSSSLQDPLFSIVGLEPSMSPVVGCFGFGFSFGKSFTFPTYL